ncbi:MAG: hypothetical protein ABIT58_07300 [Ferruginibacter sp.]
MEITIDTLEFDVNKVTKRFVIINNIRQVGINVEKAFVEWLNFSADITPESFCRFMQGKSADIICITDKEYEEGMLLKMHLNKVLD